MKSYIIATLIALAVHIALQVLWSPYFALVADCGAWLAHGHDIADIPRHLLLGNVIIGTFVIALVSGAVALVKKAA